MKFLTKKFWLDLFWPPPPAPPKPVWESPAIVDHAPAVEAVVTSTSIVDLPPPHEMDPDVEGSLTWVAASVPVKPSDGVDLIELNVWTEGARKCAEHCWHGIVLKQSHRAALALSHGVEHSDYRCCRCAHGLCHTGTRSSWLDKHPLTRYHKRVSIPVRKPGGKG